MFELVCQRTIETVDVEVFISDVVTNESKEKKQHQGKVNICFMQI